MPSKEVGFPTNPCWSNQIDAYDIVTLEFMQVPQSNTLNTESNILHKCGFCGIPVYLSKPY